MNNVYGQVKGVLSCVKRSAFVVILPSRHVSGSTSFVGPGSTLLSKNIDLTLPIMYP